MEQGKVRPVIDRTYPLRDIRDAFRYFDEGHARGKIVVTLDGSAARTSANRRHRPVTRGRSRQSPVRSSSLSDVFERVFSSTFLTITAQ